MIYIENLTFEKQIPILKYLCKIEELDIIIWLLPESKAESICEINLAPIDTIEGEPVTTYCDGDISNKTERTKVTMTLLEKIKNSKEYILMNSDSLVFYKQNDKQWLSCVIGNENILMISDDSLLATIKKQGYKASLKAPDWW